MTIKINMLESYYDLIRNGVAISSTVRQKNKG